MLEEPSVTVMVSAYVPVPVGVPLTTPAEESVRPGGILEADQVLLDPPPVAVKV